MAIVATDAETVPDHSLSSRWSQSLKSAIRDPLELCRLLDLPAEVAAAAQLAAADFELFVPREFASRMKKGDQQDPLFRQVMPLGAEVAPQPGYLRDPLDEVNQQAIPGLLQKYHGRALMMVASKCAVHCRYCFRRHFPYADVPKSLVQFEPALNSISNDQSLREVILSGGDPMMMVDRQLGELVAKLDGIQHLQRLRIHTRLPIVIPQRVEAETLAWLTRTRLTTIVVVHSNHAQEIDRAVELSLGQLVDSGIPVLNQAVLLRGVNDTADAQCELSERLINMRVMPYYLHDLDRVAGAAHFQVPAGTGEKIIIAMRKRLPGYAVPRFVREEPGEASKTVIL